MGGIAEVLLNLGYEISGSDLGENVLVKRLVSLGAEISIGHAAENIQNVDVVVTSTAIDTQNPEVIAAREQRKPIVPRAEMLAELMRFRRGIAVAGTHGKTTTTSLVASLLAEGELDPTYVIGGRLNSSASNARLGSGEYLVAEADESDASFLYLQPILAIVTNIDADHLSTYGGDFQVLKNTFTEFLHHLPFYGVAVLCLDDPEIRSLLPEINRSQITYAIEAEDADLRAVNISQQEFRTDFDVVFANGERIDGVRLNLPGRHNVLNALSAIAVAQEVGVSATAIKSALLHFQGIGRRMQSYGELKLPTGNVLLIDDYGHHPREITATIDAARQGWPQRRLVVAFQPHRYTRTHELMDDFAAALSLADVVLISEVYAAGETPIAGADGRALCRAVRARGRIDPVFVEDIQQLALPLRDVLLDGDLLLVFGAGSVGAVVAALPEQLQLVTLADPKPGDVK